MELIQRSPHSKASRQARPQGGITSGARWAVIRLHLFHTNNALSHNNIALVYDILHR